MSVYIYNRYMLYRGKEIPKKVKAELSYGFARAFFRCTIYNHINILLCQYYNIYCNSCGALTFLRRLGQGKRPWPYIMYMIYRIRICLKFIIFVTSGDPMIACFLLCYSLAYFNCITIAILVETINLLGI